MSESETTQWKKELEQRAMVGNEPGIARSFWLVLTVESKHRNQYSYKWKVPGWTRTQYVGQAGLEFTEIHCLCIPLTGLKVCAIRPGFIHEHFK